ncbi:MAG: hypothetical protein HQK75_01780 [Candidatus Magnetomorum sp.]|nr:hypothetical protein [Candidatus Magnetomorum sp.]
MFLFPCPYLNNEVELTDERKLHIQKHHPDLIPEYETCIAKTLYDPDHIRTSSRYGNAKIFSKWFSSVKNGKYIVVVVVSDNMPYERHWIITSYISRKLSTKGIIWKKT